MVCMVALKVLVNDALRESLCVTPVLLACKFTTVKSQDQTYFGYSKHS